MNEKPPAYFDRIIDLTQAYIQTKSYEVSKQRDAQVAAIEEQVENIVKFMKGINQALKEIASGE